MKPQWIIGFLLTCALAISANAQENGGVQSAEGPIAKFARQNSGDATALLRNYKYLQDLRMRGPIQTSWSRFWGPCRQS